MHPDPAPESGLAGPRRALTDNRVAHADYGLKTTVGKWTLRGCPPRSVLRWQPAPGVSSQASQARRRRKGSLPHRTNGFTAGRERTPEPTNREDQDAGEADPFRLPRRRRRATIPPLSARSRGASSRRNRISESHRRTRQSDSVLASRLPRSASCSDRDEEATDAQTSRRHHHQPFPGDSGLGMRAAGANQDPSVGPERHPGMR